MTAVPTPERTSLASVLSAPRGVAVVGASDDVAKPGGRVVAALVRHGYQGAIVPVNPGRKFIQGLECFSSVSAAPGPIDLAVLLVAPDRALDAIEDCAVAGVSVVVVGSAGFSESGAEGVALEQAVSQRADELGLRVMGPNTNGLVLCTVNMAATFTPALQQEDLVLVDGPTAIVSQSGALGGALFGIAQATGMATGTMINTGNELDVSFEEILELLVDDGSPVRSILGYVEGLRDAQRMVDVARAALRSQTAITLLKVGVSESGAAAAAAHTAKLAGSDRVFDGVMSQLGIARAATLEELLDIGRIRASGAKPHDRRVSVASLSGGAGIITADLAQPAGLELAIWSAEQQRRLSDWLPSYLSKANPIDLGGSPFWQLDKLRSILVTMDGHEGTDVNVLVIANFEAEQDRIASALIDVACALDKPLVVVWIGMAGRALDRLNKAGIPAFPEPARAVAALGKVVRCGAGSIVTGDRAVRSEARAGALAALDDADAGPEAELTPSQVRDLLDAYDLRFVEEVSCPVGQRPANLNSIVLPAVAKITGAGLEHKSDVGAVRTGLKTTQALAQAIDDLEALAASLALAEGDLLIQQEIPAGVELLLGMTHDSIFGPVITLGIGGVLAEALDDVVVRLPTLDADDVATALGSLKHQALLSGYRNLPAVDAAVVAPLVLAFCDLVNEVGDRFEAIDLNPIIIPPGTPAIAVDALFIRRNERTTP